MTGHDDVLGEAVEQLHGFNPMKDGPDYHKDDPGPIHEMAERIHKNAVAHGFWPDGRAEREALTSVSRLLGDRKVPQEQWAILEDLVRKAAGRNFGEMLSLIHSEGSEALEEHRSENRPFFFVPQTYGPDKPEGVLVELWDVIIRCLDTMFDIAEREGIDLDEVGEAKLTFNESRPHKHGRKY